MQKERKIKKKNQPAFLKKNYEICKDKNNVGIEI